MHTLAMKVSKKGMYMSSGVDQFNKLVGIIFAKSFECFPTPVEIQSSDMLEIFIDSNDFGGSFNFDQKFRDTVQWLERYDYVWIKRDMCSMGNSSYALTLTERSFEILRQTPASLEGETLGDKLVSFSKDTT